MTGRDEALSLSWERLARDTLHPTKVMILQQLAAALEPLAPKVIGDAIGVSLGSTSYHVRQLAEAKLIVLDRTEPRRGTLQHFYRLAEGVAD